jgi:hypothetical protein
MDPNLATVRNRRAQIAAQRKVLDEEDKELEIAERALTRLAATTQVSNGHFVLASGDPVQQQPVTQRDLVIATLRTHPEVWIESSGHLRAEIERNHKVQIRRTSLLPLLTTLKDEGVIRRDAHNRIALAERV